VVFILTGLVYLVGGSICIALLEANTQTWAIADRKKESTIDKNGTKDTELE